jgi:hypothetical protein
VADVLERLDPGMVGLTGLLGPQVLEQHRDAAERPVGQVGGCGRGEGLVELPMDDGVELPVEAFDPVDRGLHRLDGGEVAGADPLGEADRVEPREFVVIVVGGRVVVHRRNVSRRRL